MFSVTSHQNCGRAGGVPQSHGDWLIWLDAETVRILKEHRTAQLKARLMAGESWRDNDLIFCQIDGAPYKPDAVTRRFKRLAALAGLPVIKLHEGRHSAASLARDAAVDPEIRRRTLGHADAGQAQPGVHVVTLRYQPGACGQARPERSGIRSDDAEASSA